MAINVEELVNMFMEIGRQTCGNCETEEELIGILSQFMYQSHLICKALCDGDENRAYEYMLRQTENLFKPKMN